MIGAGVLFLALIGHDSPKIMSFCISSVYPNILSSYLIADTGRISCAFDLMEKLQLSENNQRPHLRLKGPIPKLD
jgi:hypothetical protein